jgi:hypothetical protein
MLARASRRPAGDDLRILIGGIFPAEVTDVDQDELAVGQALVEVTVVARWHRPVP